MATPRGWLVLVVCFASIQAATWLDEKTLWAGDHHMYMENAYGNEWQQRDPNFSVSFSSISWRQRLLFDPTRQILFYLDYYQISQVDESSSSRVFLPETVNDFALSLNTSTIIYVSSRGAYSIPLAEAATPTFLDIHGVDVDPEAQVFVDAGILYIATRDSVWACQPDGSHPILLWTYPSSCSLRFMFFVSDGTLYVPLSCAQGQRLFTRSPSNEVSELEIGGYLCGVFPEVQLFVYSGSHGLEVASWKESVSGGKLLESTMPISTDSAFAVIKGSFPDHEEQAIALKYCHFAGYFNGTHCICSAAYHGVSCSRYCNETECGGSCANGVCECPVGYYLDDHQHCTLRKPPLKPIIYHTRYHLVRNAQDEGMWDFFSDTSTLTTSTRNAGTSEVIYQLQDYFLAQEYFQWNSECRQQPLEEEWPTRLFPDDTLMLSEDACPRDPGRLCQQWQSPDGTVTYWTTLLNQSSVLWQEVKDDSVRYYDLDHTSLSELPHGWRNMSGCECFQTPGTCLSSSTSSLPISSFSLSSSPIPYASNTETYRTYSADDSYFEYDNQSAATWVWVVCLLGLFVLLLACVLVFVLLYQSGASPSQLMVMFSDLPSEDIELETCDSGEVDSPGAEDYVLGG